MPEDWAIVVGIDHYPEIDNTQGIVPLSGPSRDAQAFAEWLAKPEGGGLDSKRILELTSKKFERAPSRARARPTRDDIVALGEEIIEDLRRRDERARRLYLYFSGHGCSPTMGGALEAAALFMANSALNGMSVHTAPGRSSADLLRRNGRFEEVVLIMDCCRDNFAHVLGAGLWQTDGLEFLHGRLIELYATNWGRKAFERSFPPDNVKRGVFTHALLAVLESGRINGSKLKASVEHIVATMLGGDARIQQPQITADPDAGAVLDFTLFSEAAAPARSEVRITPIPGAPTPVVSSFDEEKFDLVEVLGWQEQGDPWRGRLEPGMYRLDVGGRRVPLEVFAGTPAEVELA